MAIILYDLAGADPDLRFSPYCWRTRLALAHKRLPVETLPWRFTEVERLAFSGQGKVPVIVDGETVVADSWAIADYLERAYPDRPGLFGGGRAAHAAFINAWADAVMIAGIARVVVPEVLDNLRAEDQGYFRESRERRFGCTIEALRADRDRAAEALRGALTPLRVVLRRQPWLGGDAPDYADYIVLGSLQWPRCISRHRLLAEDDPVLAWQARGLALFDTLAGGARTV